MSLATTTPRTDALWAKHHGTTAEFFEDLILHSRTLEQEQTEILHHLAEAMNELNDTLAQRDTLAQVLRKIRESYGGQMTDESCQCEDCEFLRPIDAALATLTPAKP